MRILRWVSFNLWYLHNPPWDTGISPPELIKYSEKHPPGRALDLGCGTGTNVLTLARYGWQVTGVDFALPAILSAKRKARKEGIQAKLRVGDVARAEWITGQFDLILDMGCFHGLSFEDRRAYLANINKWLAPQGVFLIYLFLRLPGEQVSTGITETELREILNEYHLVTRKDGLERGIRESTWLTLMKSVRTR
jgi:cyclopropane fatty-acyl-phospholipid synthase-like methyltransferase